MGGRGGGGRGGGGRGGGGRGGGGQGGQKGGKQKGSEKGKGDGQKGGKKQDAVDRVLKHRPLDVGALLREAERHPVVVALKLDGYRELPQLGQDIVSSDVSKLGRLIELLRRKCSADMLRNVMVGLYDGVGCMMFKYVGGNLHLQWMLEEVALVRERVRCDPRVVALLPRLGNACCAGDDTDFRALPIVPSLDELSASAPYLPPLPAASSVRDPTAHLGRQFRLLREDMVAPIREEFESHCRVLRQPHALNSDDRRAKMRQFHDVDILAPWAPARRSEWSDEVAWWEHPKLEGIRLPMQARSAFFVVRFKYPVGHPVLKDKPRDRIENSRRLLCEEGLVCFIERGRCVCLAKVVYRDVQWLIPKPAALVGVAATCRESGEALCRLMRRCQQHRSNIMMVQLGESLLSQPPVLRALQLQRDVAFRGLVLTRGTHVAERLRLPESSSLDACVNELNTHQKLTEVHGAQKNAMVSAFVNRLTLVQGPPGTGKTFVGTWVVDILKRNVQGEKILLVAYTNHALDQFMQKLHDACGVPWRDMVRCGSLKDDSASDGLRSTELRGRTVSGNKAEFAVAYRGVDEASAEVERCAKACWTGMHFYDVQQHLMKRGRHDDAKALKIPKSQNGFDVAGKNGKALKPYAFFEDWRLGKRAPTGRDNCTLWQMSKEERSATLEEWYEEMGLAGSLIDAMDLVDKRKMTLQQLRKQSWRDAVDAAKIVGCTSTFLATNADVFGNVTTVVLEEAGEMLESTTLTCMHLPRVKRVVQIGDHKQLRPKVAHYPLSVESGGPHKFNISMFERLALEGFPLHALDTQHRMRPEISEYPRMNYDRLLDHASVGSLRQVGGLKSPVIFINHRHLEGSACDTTDEGAKVNHHEARLVARIVRHVLRQGVRSDDLVVLTPYLGQLRVLKRELAAMALGALLSDRDTAELSDEDKDDDDATTTAVQKTVRVSTVDNYQGEEADVVVASLVRSNEKGIAGWTGQAERTNVLLSRARRCEILVGNMDTLAKKSTTWQSIRNVMAERGVIYDGLPTVCKHEHPRVLRTVDDFDKFSPDGGCLLPCGEELPCGHKCPLQCHRLPQHQNVCCTAEIIRMCEKGHRYMQQCGRGRECDICKKIHEIEEAHKKEMEAARRRRQEAEQEHTLKLERAKTERASVEEGLRDLEREQERKQEELEEWLATTDAKSALEKEQRVHVEKLRSRLEDVEREHSRRRAEREAAAAEELRCLKEREAALTREAEEAKREAAKADAMRETSLRTINRTAEQAAQHATIAARLESMKDVNDFNEVVTHNVWSRPAVLEEDSKLPQNCPAESVLAAVLDAKFPRIQALKVCNAQVDSPLVHFCKALCEAELYASSKSGGTGFPASELYIRANALDEGIRLIALAALFARAVHVAIENGLRAAAHEHAFLLCGRLASKLGERTCQGKIWSACTASAKALASGRVPSMDMASLARRLERGRGDDEDAKQRAEFKRTLEEDGWRKLGKKIPAFRKLCELTGLRKVKNEIAGVLTGIIAARDVGRDPTKTQYSARFVGNPGTGKTTIARLYGQCLEEVGVFSKANEFVETSGTKLMLEGPDKAKKALEKASSGGVVFIDEAYQLVEGRDPRGGQILDLILTEVENKKGRLVVVLAGYVKAIDKLIATNEGLRSRFPRDMRFDDYTNAELLSILKGVINRDRSTKDGLPVFEVDDPRYLEVAVRRAAMQRGSEGFGNAREMGNLYEKMCERHAERAARMQVPCRVLKREDILGPRSNEARTCAALRDLHALEGLQDVKEAVSNILDAVDENARLEEELKPPRPLLLNRVLVGNPGTGKTTVAEHFARILKAAGILSKGDVVKKTATDFIGSVIGESSKLTSSILEGAKGCVLVIDEAYGLDPSLSDVGGSKCPYKEDVVNTLVEKVSGTGGDDRCILLLGYRDRLQSMMDRCNPGLKERFQMSKCWEFADYDDDQLFRVLRARLEKLELRMDPAAMTRVVDEVIGAQRRKPNFANVRAVENAVADAIVALQKRTRQGNTLIYEDFSGGSAGAQEAMTASVSDIFADLEGCGDLVTRFERLRNTCMRAVNAGGKATNVLPMAFRFVGAPGTGKTTVAKRIGRLYAQLGVLAPGAEVVVKSCSDLLTGYAQQAAKKTREAFRDALGQVLFIDEAYRLADASSREVVDEMVDIMTDDEFRGKQVVILGGYKDAIDKLMAVNEGLRSRFPEEVEFQNFSPDACVAMLKRKCAAQHPSLELSAAAVQAAAEAMEELTAMPGWANARDVETLVKRLYEEHANSGLAPEDLVPGAMVERVFQRFEEGMSKNISTQEAQRTDTACALPAAVQSASAPPPPSAPLLSQATATSGDEAVAAHDADAAMDDAVAAGCGSEVWAPLSHDFLEEVTRRSERLGYSTVDALRRGLDDPNLTAGLDTHMATLWREIWREQDKRREEVEREARKKRQRPIYRCAVCGRIGCPVAPYVDGYEDVPE